MAIISIRKLSKSFGENKVLKGLNLDIEKGKTTVIVGQSGSGKSVLIKHIIGLLRPDSGNVIVDGVDVTKLRGSHMREVLQKFGMLFQFAALFDSLTVMENVGFALRERKQHGEEEIKSIVKDKLSKVGLYGVEDKYPAELSGGMKKRVGLARALATDPEIVLFDEPTSGLDPVTAATINHLIIRLQERLRITGVVISHDINSSFQIGHEIAMLYNGKIVEKGTSEEIKNSNRPIVRKFISGSFEGFMGEQKGV